MPKNTKAAGRPTVQPTERRLVSLTHLNKILFPEIGISKGDVIAFYEKISPQLLPHLKDRPVTLERLPEGLTGPESPHFWQKNTPDYYPSWIPRIELASETGKPIHYVLVNDQQTLLYLVNQGTLTFHVYLSRVQSLDCPDYVLFDLDPGEAPFENVVKIAKTLVTSFERIGLRPKVKTSGKTGLHLTVEWKEKGGYDEARDWAMSVANQTVEKLPEIATTERSKKARSGRVYIDVIQNAKGHHVVPPYVIRATPTATVSTPITKAQLREGLDPKRFNIQTLIAKGSKKGRAA